MAEPGTPFEFRATQAAAIDLRCRLALGKEMSGLGSAGRGVIVPLAMMRRGGLVDLPHLVEQAIG